jgi:hypothetical protein
MRGIGMRRVLAVLVGLGLAFAFDASAADEAGGDRPRGVCNFSQPGLSMVIEDTTEEACTGRQLECGHDNPGHEADCRARWTISEEKANRARKGKSAGRAETVPR